MSKINNAVHEIRTIDTLAARDQWVNQIHPLVKLVLTIGYIALLVSFPKYDVAGTAGMVIYPLAVFILSELSFADSIRRLRLVLPLVCFIGIFNPLFDKNMIQLGTQSVSAGVLSMATLLMKGIFSVLASYLLVATTTIEKLCCCLRLLHVPRAFVTQLMLMYRYVTVLLGEAERITQAYALRAPRQKGVHFKVWGSLAGMLLLHSVDRAKEIYEGMELRGYRGEYPYMQEEITLKGSDMLYFAFWCSLLLCFRHFPVILLIGSVM